MINRIVGTNSGIDVDTVVKQSLSNEQKRIDKSYQKQKIYEYQREQLRDIVNSARKFYDNYLDVISSKNLILDSAYETVNFTSSDESVTARGFAGADVTDYSVSVNQLAKKARTILTDDYFKDVVDSGKGVLCFEMKEGNDSSAVNHLYIDLVTVDEELDMSSVVNKLNNELRKNGISVTAKYSELEKGIVLESNDYGDKVDFGVSIKEGVDSDYAKSHTSDFRYQHYSGQNAKGIIKKGTAVYQIDSPSNIVNVDNVEFKLNSVTKSNTSAIIGGHLSKSDLSNKVTIESYDKKISSVTKDNRNILTKTYNEGITLKTIRVFDSYGIVDDTKTKTSVVGDLEPIHEEDRNVEVTVDPHTNTKTLRIKKPSGGYEDKETIIDIDSGKSTTTYTNSDGIKIITTRTKKVIDGEEKTEIESKVLSGNLKEDILPSDVKTTIESGDGKTRTTVLNSVNENGKKVTNTTTVSVADDGSSLERISVNVEGESSVPDKLISNEPVKISGKTDVTKLKDTIIKFINDYNEVLKSINDKIWEKRDKDYMPLTDEQKKEMSDKEIEEWEKKAKTGLLRNDSDLVRIQAHMKEAMSSFMSGTGLKLEKIGIKPVKDYTTKNGMFEVDEIALTQALESNAGEVKELFIRPANGDDKGGVLTQLKNVMRSEFDRTSSNSSLSRRIGFEGTSTEAKSILGDNINQQKKIIKDLQKKYKTKEDALYKKYSNLEVMLEKLNSQSTSLASLLGNNY